MKYGGSDGSQLPSPAFRRPSIVPGIISHLASSSGQCGYRVIFPFVPPTLLPCSEPGTAWEFRRSFLDAGLFPVLCLFQRRWHSPYYGHTTTAMHDMSAPPPSPWLVVSLPVVCTSKYMVRHPRGRFVLVLACRAKGCVRLARSTEQGKGVARPADIVFTPTKRDVWSNYCYTR